MKPQEELLLRESNLIEGVGLEGLGGSKKAYLYLMQVREPLTLKHILKVHRLLMSTLNPRIAGKLRQVAVGIYSDGKLVKNCPDYTTIPQLMTHFLQRVNDFNNKTGSYCQSCHITFELMHPFEDGNGRCGRLILAWMRKQFGLPLVIIYNRDKEDYYAWFK